MPKSESAQLSVVAVVRNATRTTSSNIYSADARRCWPPLFTVFAYLECWRRKRYGARVYLLQRPSYAESDLLRRILQRGLNDLLNLPNRPVVSYGPPGRSANTGHIVTVFGCTGFLGRYLVAKLGTFAVMILGFSSCGSHSCRTLAKAGTQVIVPYREEDEKRHLKVMGDLGQIVPMVRATHLF